MFGLGKRHGPTGPTVNSKLCTDRFNGRYPHVGLYDCREDKVWVCKPLSGQAIRTSHARLITGADNATGTVWKDRFICFWFYTPKTGEGLIHGQSIDWEEAHLLVRIDPQWDYDRQQLIPAEMESQIAANLERQMRCAERIFEFYTECKLSFPLSLHMIGAKASDSLFHVKRMEGRA